MLMLPPKNQLGFCRENGGGAEEGKETLSFRSRLGWGRAECPKTLLNGATAIVKTGSVRRKSSDIQSGWMTYEKRNQRKEKEGRKDGWVVKTGFAGNLAKKRTFFGDLFRAASIVSNKPSRKNVGLAAGLNRTKKQEQRLCSET